VRLLSSALFTLLCVLTACGRGNPSTFLSNVSNGPLSGNWQLNLLQQYPTASAGALSASGFLVQSNNLLTGSVQGPDVNSNACSGIGVLSGTISGQSVTFTENLGGTVYTFTGVISTDNQSMSGDYQALGGACFTSPTTGTWNALLIPAVNGNFTGTFSNSEYMIQFTGLNNPPPVAVTGSLSQSAMSEGVSSASVTGTITAVGYPCFSTATLVGTVSGQNMLLAVYSYTGEQIGTLGPLVVTSGSDGPSLTGGAGSLTLGVSTRFVHSGPCPPIGSPPIVQDAATAQLQITSP
jgi:hypothetical protein